MSLEAAIRVRQGTFDLDVELDAADGEIVALLGPNGAGKSTALRVLAGLVAVHEGHIALGEGPDRVVLDSTRGGAEVFVPPEQRRVAMVFQDYLLFRHLSAVENVAFGLRATGTGRKAALDIARDALERLGLGAVASQRSTTLSGGQAQRVALARALVTRPEMLLLDEPLAALDVGTRNETRRELRTVLRETEGVRLLVTHDPVDAHVLADRVVVIEEGRVVQSGSLAEVTSHPRSRYVADLVGINLVEGTMRDGVVVTASGASIVARPDERVAPNATVWAAIAPSAVVLHPARPEGSARNVWRCRVTDLDHRQGRVRVTLEGPVPVVAEIVADTLSTLGLRPGDEVWAAVKATEVRVYPA